MTGIPESPPTPNRERIGFWVPAIIVVFLLLTLVGTYCVRLVILKNTMLAAMEIGDSATMGELANSWPSPVMARDKDRRTPLHRAVEWGDRALAELLLRKGADVHATAYVGWTPLHEAANRRRADIAELLIARGADVDARSQQGFTPLYWAVLTWNKELIDLLIANGADVDAKDNNGRTLLHRLATDHGIPEVVAYVLAKGADINARDNLGVTALQLAIGVKNTAVAELLRKAYARLGLLDETRHRSTHCLYTLLLFVKLLLPRLVTTAHGV